MTLEQLDLDAHKKINFNLNFITYTKINSKSKIDLCVKHKTIKLLTENRKNSFMT